MTTIYELSLGGQTKRSRITPFARKVEWNGLPDVSQDFIARYGLKQYLADAMAGASDQADAEAKVDARLAKLVSGDLSRTKGEGGDKPDTEQGRALKLARAAIRDMLKAKNKTATKEQVAEAAKALVEKNPKYLAEAKKQLAAEAKSKEALVDDETADILADLLSEVEPEADEADDAE
jgi:hypothetical protein